MEGYQQLFALIKNPKYVKMRLPKNGRSSELNNTANAGRIVRSRNGRKILPAFLLTILSRHLPPPRYRRKKENAPKSIRRRSGKRSFEKAVEMARHDSHQGRGKLPPCMPQSECGTGHTGYRIFSDPSPGGSQDTGGAFRSRVQRSGVRHRSTGAGHIAPCGSVLTWHK